MHANFTRTTVIALQLTHQFGLLSIYGIAELKQCLELIIFGECDYLHHCPKLGEDLNGKRTSISVCTLGKFFKHT